jgi:hypothetical protein
MIAPSALDQSPIHRRTAADAIRAMPEPTDEHDGRDGRRRSASAGRAAAGLLETGTCGCRRWVRSMG